MKIKDLRTVSICYHKSVKRVAGMNIWDNNHVACERVGVSMMKHLIVKRILGFYYRAIGSKVVTMRKLRYFIMFKSMIYMRISKIMREKYSLPRVADNDALAVLARIDFVEKHEPRSNYVPDPP